MTTAQEIERECEALAAFLAAKNRAYGDSALDPVRIFSRVDALEQINVRIDDKLSRIARGREFEGDDTELDLIGYLMLRRIQRRRQRPQPLPEVPDRGCLLKGGGVAA